MTTLTPQPQNNPPDPQVPSPPAAAAPAAGDTTATNPPNPQIPSATTQSRVRTATPAAVNNPPDPQVSVAPQPASLPVSAPPENPQRDPVTGALRIDITGTAPPVVNDEVTTLPPADQPAPRVPLPVPPAEGISPYGEEDDRFEPPPTVTPRPVAPAPAPQPVESGPGITGPVEGISPYGEEDERDAVPTTAPQDVQFTDDYTSSDDAANLEAAAAAEADAFRRGQFPAPVTGDPQVDPNGPAFDDDGNLNPGFTLDGDGEPIFIGPDFIDPSLTASAEESRRAAQQQATLDRARQQATLQQQRKQANDGDWRVKLRLAPGAQYLYRAAQPGILQPLAVTDGVIFPYTPTISTVYKANYSSYNPTHSNFRGLFYQGSQVEDISIQAKFTAQDSNEAQYMLAVIHFFRSITKMFYGQDPQRGAPPPLVFLQGLGEYQFNLHPCVVGSFTYNLPDGVDYIRAGSPNINGTNLLQRRDRQNLPTNSFSSALERIINVLGAQNVKKGAIPAPPAPPTLGTNSPTYVPTVLDVQLILHPAQSRSQVSKQFGLQQFANGDLQRGGFW